MVELSKKEQEFMRKKYFASFGIVSPTTDLPLVTTVWAHYHEGKFYVITNKGTAKWRYLRDGNRKVGINIMDPKGWPYISVNGTVDIFFQNDRDDFWDIVTDIIKKYNSTEQAVANWLKKMRDAGDRMLLELEPENMYSTV